MKTQTKLNHKVIQHGIDNLDNSLDGTYGCDLHNSLFNQDYFIIGYYEADQFLCEVGVMNAIRLIQEYEQHNFGEVNTPFGDSEKMANMYAYIVGEQALQESKTLRKNWDNKLTEDDIKSIREELENLL